MSMRLPEPELMLLTSVSHLAHLTPEQLVVVTFDGEVVEGALDSASREIVGMHSCVYRAREEVNAVIHTHSPRATSFALAHQPLPCVYEAFLRFGITEDVPVAQWAPRGSREAVDYIVEQLQQHPTASAVLLANHGLLAFSGDALMAAQLIIIMEESAQLTLDARTSAARSPSRQARSNGNARICSSSARSCKGMQLSPGWGGVLASILARRGLVDEEPTRLLILSLLQ